MATLVPEPIREKIDEYLSKCYQVIESKRDEAEILSELLYISYEMKPDPKLNSSKVLNEWVRVHKQNLKTETEKVEMLIKAIGAIFHHNELLRDGEYENLEVDVEYMPRQAPDQLISRKEAQEMTLWTQQNFYEHERKGNLVPYNWRGEQVKLSYKDQKYYNRATFMKVAKGKHRGRYGRKKTKRGRKPHRSETSS